MSEYDVEPAPPAEPAKIEAIKTPAQAKAALTDLQRYGHYSPRGTKCKLCGKVHS